MKRFVMTFVLVFLAIVFVSCQATPSTTTATPTGDNVGAFASYSQLENYLKSFYKQKSGERWYLFSTTAVTGAPEMDNAEGSVDFTDGERDYSKTNNQEEGVEEADTILTDGYYIYITSGDKFFIVDAETLEIKFTYTDESNYWSGLYLYNDKVVLIGSYYRYFLIDDPEDTTTETVPSEDGDEVKEPYYYPYYYYTYEYGTKVVVFDKSDIDNVEVSRELDFDSSYITSSRMIDGTLYLIMNNYAIRYYYEEDNFIPKYLDSVRSDEMELLPANRIYFMPNDSNDFSYLLLASIAVDTEEEANVKAYLGSIYQVYMSTNNLYATVYRFNYDYETQTYDDKTFILRFAIEDNELVYKAFAEIEGNPLNQFSMDEHEGNFRIAVTDYDYTNEGMAFANNLIILDATSDDEMTFVSSLTGLGKPGERIYSVRFLGDIAYVVTFVNTDPLYKLDLSNPEEPKILGEHYEEGVSDYLHEITDNLMVGVGRQAETNEYNQTFFTGVKVALYDTSGDTPVNLETYLVEGEYSYTAVTYNHKYFMSFTPKDADFTYVAIPVSVYFNNYYRYSQSMFVFKIYHSGDLEMVAQLEHETANYFDSIEKAVMIDNYIYTLSYSQIQVFNMNDGFSFVDKVVLNETYYQDYYYTEEPVASGALD
jgi:uncharacterized secreted protein with C-terminal beta-propeller domain